MGSLLKDVMQATIEIYPGNSQLPVSKIKALILSKVGPISSKASEFLTVAFSNWATLSNWFWKFYGKKALVTHEAALKALSRMFNPELQQETSNVQNTEQNAEERNLHASTSLAAAAHKPAALADDSSRLPPASLARKTRREQHGSPVRPEEVPRLHRPGTLRPETPRSVIIMENNGIGSDVNNVATGGNNKGNIPTKIPTKIPVLCNNRHGILLMNSKTVVCECNLCAETAAAVGKPYLNLSLHNFEWHSGAGQVNNWEESVTTGDPHQLPIGKLFKSIGLAPDRCPVCTSDDKLLVEAQLEREMRLLRDGKHPAISALCQGAIQQYQHEKTHTQHTDNNGAVTLSQLCEWIVTGVQGLVQQQQAGQSQHHPQRQQQNQSGNMSTTGRCTDFERIAVQQSQRASDTPFLNQQQRDAASNRQVDEGDDVAGLMQWGQRRKRSGDLSNLLDPVNLLKPKRHRSNDDAQK